LRSFIDQLHLPLLTNNHNIQIRVWMDTISNNVAATSGSICTKSGVTNCNLLFDLLLL
jgi:hypothetical protein